MSSILKYNPDKEGHIIASESNGIVFIKVKNLIYCARCEFSLPWT